MCCEWSLCISVVVFAKHLLSIVKTWCRECLTSHQQQEVWEKKNHFGVFKNESTSFSTLHHPNRCWRRHVSEALTSPAAQPTRLLNRVEVTFKFNGLHFPPAFIATRRPSISARGGDSSPRTVRGRRISARGEFPVKGKGLRIVAL